MPVAAVLLALAALTCGFWVWGAHTFERRAIG